MSAVVHLANARVRRLLGRLGALYEKRDAAEQQLAIACERIDETLAELDEARLQAATVPLPDSVAAGGR
jgi:hypothetical protein